jgi:hypothetical protein
MASVQTGIADGMLTAEELKANGCKGIPASQFLKAAKAVSFVGRFMRPLKPSHSALQALGL